ncbi:glutathione S-transferase family protein [Saccharospirillum salsuginis]|uniref:glutathione transferase n=1 Tax=Saccharospirillum salsuginis TaxID=418750 RepID=A0A918K1W7_9GAMM|nr:glutathione S-transferase family protein [Saccharospirillum salsuginis]GGX43582.1 glutathione S-transferase [Saccharospirillum salsuginis]
MIELITHVLCPYVQRSVIVLQEKDMPYRRTDIDLANKPDWFRSISPLGKVPVLVTGERRSLFESAVICEYLNEITPGSLHPEDALERAEHRAWIEFGSGLLNRIAQLYNAPTREAFDAVRETLADLFRQLEDRLEEGPFFSGEPFRMIDAVYGPIFRYFDVFDSVVDLDVFREVPRVQAWRANLEARETVRTAVSADYPERLLAFVRNRGSYLSSRVAEALADPA